MTTRTIKVYPTKTNYDASGQIEPLASGLRLTKFVGLLTDQLKLLDPVEMLDAYIVGIDVQTLGIYARKSIPPFQVLLEQREALSAVLNKYREFGDVNSPQLRDMITEIETEMNRIQQDT